MGFAGGAEVARTGVEATRGRVLLGDDELGQKMLSYLWVRGGEVHTFSYGDEEYAQIAAAFGWDQEDECDE